MEAVPKGYLHNKLDVKVLILFILARIDTPLTGQEIYEIAYQDDSLNYFMMAESLPELVKTGHIQADAKGRYTITEKGCEQGADVEDSLAVAVVEKVSAAITKKQIQIRREANLTTEVQQNERGDWTATLCYQDNGVPMMTLSVMAPNEELGRVMAENLRRHADELYRVNMDMAMEYKKQRDL